MIHWLPFFIYLLTGCGLLRYFWVHHPNPGERVTLLTLFIYITVILYLCLTPTTFNISSAPKKLSYIWGVPYNIVPLQGISQEFFLNIVMTFPFGVYLFLINHHLPIGKIIASCFCFSLFIEANQFIWDLLIHLGRLADIDDLITNTFGGTIGYGLTLFLAQTPIRRLIHYFSIK